MIKTFWRQLFILQLLILCPTFSAWGGLASDTIYLTWQKCPSNTMTIQWISPLEQTESTVVYRPKQPLPFSSDSPEFTHVKGESFNLPQSKEYLVHRVELRNLFPDTDYVFKVLPYDQEYGFRTAPARLDNKGIRFVTGGDMYHDDIKFMEQTSRQAAKTDPLFALIGGDIAYAVASLHSPIQKMDRWIDWIKSWHSNMVTPQGNLVPVIAAIGNHDLIGQYDQTPAQAAVFSSLFPMPGSSIYNVLDFNAYLSIILLDSGHANSIGGQQAFWLRSTLEDRKKTLHRLAIYHVPAYPSIRDYYNNSYSSAIRRHWVPIFESGGIQTVFENHDHAYKRTFPLLNHRVNPDGVLYLGDGGWGVEKPRRPSIKQKRSYLAKFSAARHFILVTLTPTQQQFKAISDTGEIMDDYTKEIKMSAPRAIFNCDAN